MHRPTQSFKYGTRAEAINNMPTSQASRIGQYEKRMLKIMQDPRQFRYDETFKNIDQFRMPEGVRNQQWLRKADSARRNVSKVWSLARDNYKRMYKKLKINLDDTEYLVRLLSYHDNPDHLATVAREREEILANIAISQFRKGRPSIDPGPYQSPFPHVSTLSDLPEKAARFSANTKSKIKTRHQERPSITEQAVPGDSEPTITPKSAPVPASLPLPKKSKSLETLRLLFPTASSDLEGTIQWTDFIATMRELGFHGEHRGGSEWTFRSFGNSEVDVAESKKEGIVRGKRSIVIHQPHPETKMGSLSLQWIGKRLWRRFGWARECFEGL